MRTSDVFSAARVLSLVVGFAAVSAQAIAQPARFLSIPENLVAEGVDSIPTDLPERLRRYTEFRTASHRDWHPNRREMLIGTRFGNAVQIHSVATPLGARRQLTFFEEPIGGGTFEPNAGRYFIFAKDRGGDEFDQLYRYDVASGDVTLLTDGGRSQNGGVRWSSRGDRIAYGSTRRNGRDRDIYVLNPANARADRLTLQVDGGGWSVSDWSPDDRTLLVSEYRSIVDSDLWLVDVQTGNKRRLIERRPAEKVVIARGRFSADGQHVYFVTDRDSEFAYIAALNLASRQTVNLTPGSAGDVEQLALSDDRTMLAYTINEAGISRLYLLDLRTRRSRPMPGLPVGVISALNWHQRLPELAVTLASARAPSDVYSVDAHTGAVTRWTESELGGMTTSSLSEPRLIRWQSWDGREITGFYYRPPVTFTGRRPVIVSIHGGPESQARPGFLGRTNYYLNELGVAVIYPNVRGSSGFGKTFVKLDDAMQREGSVRDIATLLDWIATQPDLDPSRVLVTGGSYGGYMTLMAATTLADRICCALDVVGISNLATFLTNTESYRRDLRRAEYGDERIPEIRDWMNRTAPLTNASHITKPLFVVQGANDPRVPRTEAEQIVAAVRRNNIPVWYLMARDEGHGFDKKSNVDYQFYSSVLFIRRFLLGDPGRAAPSP